MHAYAPDPHGLERRVILIIIPHADGERGGIHLEEGEGLEIDLAVAAWVAGLADVGHHDGHPSLVRIWIAFAHLQMGAHNGQGLD